VIKETGTVLIKCLLPDIGRLHICTFADHDPILEEPHFNFVISFQLVFNVEVNLISQLTQ